MKNIDTKQYFSACVTSIADMVKFDSAQAPALPGMPFGKGAADCLNAFLQLAQNMGFETHNYDNYVGEVIFGDGAEEFAVLAHLDVVPAGEGWAHPPFAGEIADGKLYGRGTMDDKGPAVIALYCMKALKDAGFVPSKKIKLIVGCNEENGWACIDHYNQVAHMPEIGFSPDADFPAIYAEKGILQFRMEFPILNAPITALYGGERPNMVCDFAVCEGAPFDAARAKQFGIEVEGGKLVARGVAAHASTPDEGVNALSKLLGYLAPYDEELANAYNVFFNDSLGLKKMEDETGRLTMSANVAEFQDKLLRITVDIRYPAAKKRCDVTDILDTLALPYELLHCQEPLYNDKNGFLITALQKVYAEKTGSRSEAIAIGGGTYARALKNGAGFGPQFPGEPSTIHQKDEYISLENVQKLLDIYAAAIYELTK